MPRMNMIENCKCSNILWTKKESGQKRLFPPLSKYFGNLKGGRSPLFGIAISPAHSSEKRSEFPAADLAAEKSFPAESAVVPFAGVPGVLDPILIARVGLERVLCVRGRCTPARAALARRAC